MARLEEHIVDNKLHDPSQSGCKKCNSTITALLKINNDILVTLTEKSHAFHMQIMRGTHVTYMCV